MGGICVLADAIPAYRKPAYQEAHMPCQENSECSSKHCQKKGMFSSWGLCRRSKGEVTATSDNQRCIHNSECAKGTCDDTTGQCVFDHVTPPCQVCRSRELKDDGVCVKEIGTGELELADLYMRCGNPEKVGQAGHS